MYLLHRFILFLTKYIFFSYDTILEKIFFVIFFWYFICIEFLTFCISQTNLLRPYVCLYELLFTKWLKKLTPKIGQYLINIFIYKHYYVSLFMSQFLSRTTQLYISLASTLSWHYSRASENGRRKYPCGRLGGCRGKFAEERNEENAKEAWKARDIQAVLRSVRMRAASRRIVARNSVAFQFPCMHCSRAWVATVFVHSRHHSWYGQPGRVDPALILVWNFLIVLRRAAVNFPIFFDDSARCRNTRLFTSVAYNGDIAETCTRTRPRKS